MVNKVNLVGLVEGREAFMDKCLIVLYFLLICRFHQEQNCSFFDTSNAYTLTLDFKRMPPLS